MVRREVNTGNAPSAPPSAPALEVKLSGKRNADEPPGLSWGAGAQSPVSRVVEAEVTQ